ALERPGTLGREAGEDDVFLDVEAAEDASLLRHQLHARPRDPVGRLAGEVGAVEHDAARARAHHAHQRLQRRALAGAIASEQGDDLVRLDAQGDVEKDVGIAVVAVESGDFEQAHGTTLRAARSGTSTWERDVALMRWPSRRD